LSLSSLLKPEPIDWKTKTKGRKKNVEETRDKQGGLGEFSRSVVKQREKRGKGKKQFIHHTQ